MPVVRVEGAVCLWGGSRVLCACDEGQGCCVPVVRVEGAVCLW